MEYNGGVEDFKMRVSMWILSKGNKDGSKFEKGQVSGVKGVLSVRC